MVRLATPGAPPPEPLRATELKNRPCVVKPLSRGVDEERDWKYLVCEVWLLDRSGVERHEDEVRISWKRAVPQLEDKFGEYVACRPKETDGGGVVLVGLDGEAQQVAERIISELDGQG